MFRKVSGERPDRVSFLLVPNFSMSAFTAMLEALRLANYATGRTLYEWEILSRDGDAVEASNGVHVVANKGIADEPHPDNVVVCSGVGAQLYQDNAVFGWLRRWAREGAHVGALCTGAHVLAHAGLLKGYRCTIHWENLESFREQHPELDVQAELFEIDRDRFTCAGGIAAADMMLTEIARRHGDEVASAVSELFMHERIREGHDNQRLPLQARLRISHPKLIRAIAEMETYVEEALSREEIAARVGLSRRQLERLFRRYLNTSPARYYLRLRLERARLLLTQTTMPVTEIAFACGFTSASHFSKCYRDMFGRTPRDQRRTGSNGGDEHDRPAAVIQ
jgi:transcriptional regulator GlxA family with amidase domain